MYPSVRPAPVHEEYAHAVPLKAVEHSLLHYLNRYHYLSAKQLCTLCSRKGKPLGTLTRMQTVCSSLTARGYLQRERVPAPTYEGSREYCYSLATPGRNALRAMGEDVAPRFRPKEAITHGLAFTAHTVEVNQVLIAGELLCRQYPALLRLDDFLHERDMKRQLRVELKQAGRTVPRFVEPDGFLGIGLPAREKRRSVLLELDHTGHTLLRTATERQKAWKQKVLGLLALITPDSSGVSPYTAFFGRKSVTFMIVTTAGERRRDNLARWTHEVLQERGESQYASLFFFTAASASACTPEEFYCGSHWITPLNESPLPLLALREEADHV